jgi:thioester reductase-like protein
MRALITGATGFLGREILRTLLARDERLRLVALMRAGTDLALERRRHRLIEGLAAGDADRVTALRGDMTEPRLGLSADTHAALVAGIDRVIHVAAATSFNHSLPEARRRNVGGTAHALELCRALRASGKSGRLDYVSTAYVAGDRRDLAREDELDVGQGFRNTYERSKCEAEALCRAAAAELPVAIYRPSIVVGDSGTGATASYKALYWPMQLFVPFYLRWPRVTAHLPVPFRRACSLDIVPVDWVAGAVATLWDDPDAAGRCYHLAGGTAAPTAEQLVALICDHFRFPRVGHVDPGGGFGRVARALRPVLRRFAPALVTQAEFYMPYALGNPRFDTTNARAAGLEPPPAAAYFPRILAYAWQTGFGRAPLGRPPGAPSRAAGWSAHP